MADKIDLNREPQAVYPDGSNLKDARLPPASSEKSLSERLIVPDSEVGVGVAEIVEVLTSTPT